MNKRYLIKLKPIGNFYFGSERNFEQGQSYYARSLMFPQQTTLLGVLRYKLLQADGLLTSKNHGTQIDGKALNLIGEKGFSADNFNEPGKYGAIKGLSHLFLMCGDEIFYPGNLDYDYTFAMDEDGKSLTDSERKFIPMLSGFDPKHQPSHRMVSNKGSRLDNCEIFKEVEQAGNFKTNRRFEPRGKAEDRDEERGFYKQVSYRFREAGWEFAFLADIEESNGEKLVKHTNEGGRLTHIGGERSPFNFLIDPCRDDFHMQLSSNAFYSTSAAKKLTKAVLISDAYVNEPIYDACDFAVSETVDFRFISSTVKGTKNYHKFGSDGVQKSDKKYNLLKRGSVFYISEGKLDEFNKKIMTPKAFCQIGFNSYLIVNSKVELHSSIIG